MKSFARFDLEGKVALVTGASKGLGRGFAFALAEAGAKVICAGRNPNTLERTAEEIKNAGGKADSLRLDVTCTSDIAPSIREALNRHQRLDILINNAGTEIVRPFLEVSEKEYDTVMATNLRGGYFTAQAAARVMVGQGGGKIVNVGSLGSAIGLPGSSVYCASKGGVLQLTRTMALELARLNVQVNAIGPGYYRTDMTEPFFQNPEDRERIESSIPMGRIGTADDLAGCLVFLASDASKYITGQIFYVDGGWLAGA